MAPSTQLYNGRLLHLRDVNILIALAFLIDIASQRGSPFSSLVDDVVRWQDDVPRWGANCIDLRLDEVLADATRKRDMLALLDRAIERVRKQGPEIAGEWIHSLIPPSVLGPVRAATPAAPIVETLIKLRALITGEGGEPVGVP